eukprot:scaffold634_cov401-Prasinococcus_capsulatus_cf.AAC.2
MADKAVKSRALLKVLGKALETQGESLVAKFKGVVRFNIDGVEFLLDLKNGSGSIQVRQPALRPLVTIGYSSPDRNARRRVERARLN